MENAIRTMVQKCFGQDALSIEPLGGGFYGRAFLIRLKDEPFCVVAKIYLFRGLAEKEALQIRTLSLYSVLKMPRIYAVFKAESIHSDYDGMLMEYLDGVNAGDQDVSAFSEETKNTICDNIVDNLIAFHNIINDSGFGELNSNKYFATWQEFYRPRAAKVVRKAKELLVMGQISETIMQIFEKSFNQFDSVFYLPITKARLIHGDYNTWNIMLNHEKTKAEYVIDPFVSCYADSEYDLYQLDNANGKEYRLLEKYASKFDLSENFEVKKRFYRLYSEIGHYYDAHVPVELDAVEQMGRELLEAL